MSEKITKGQKVVFDSVCKNKGDSTAAITWRHLGGGFTEGTAVGVITITPAQLVFALGLKARASELVKMGRLERKGKALGCVAGTSGDGSLADG